MSEFTHAAKIADEAASVAHDFICGKNTVTETQASDAIWCIHDALRPFIPLRERADYPADAIALVTHNHPCPCTSCRHDAWMKNGDVRGAGGVSDSSEAERG